MMRTHASAALLWAMCCACAQAGEKEGQTAYPVPAVVESGEVVAAVGPVILTTAELEKRIAQQSPFVRAQLKDPEQKKRFVENEVRVELLAQEGWRRGLHNDPRIQAELKRAVVQRVMRDEMATLQDKVDLSEEELRQAYAKKTAEYNKPPTIRLSQIKLQLNAKGEAEHLFKKLQDDHKKNIGDVAFADAARKNSEDVGTRNGGGDMQFLSREQLAEQLGKEAADRWFDQKEVGEMGMEQTATNVLILKKTGARRGVERTLEMVKPQLRSQVLGEKKQKAFDDLVEELKKKYGVVIDHDAAGAIPVRLDQPTETSTPAHGGGAPE